MKTSAGIFNRDIERGSDCGADGGEFEAQAIFLSFSAKPDLTPRFQTQ
jgi:hypothetical protein